MLPNCGYPLRIMWFLSENWARDLAFLLLALLAATAFWMAAHALFPKFSDQSSRRWQRPWQDIGLGLAILLLFFLLALGVQRWVSNSTVLNVLGVLGGCLAGALSLGALAGLAGLALRIGDGMKGAREDRHSWLVFLRGSVVLAAICGFPVLNIFLILPVLLAGGLGNSIMTLLRWKPPRLGRARGVGSRGLSRSGRGEGEHLDRPARQPRRTRPPRRRDDPDASRTEPRRTTAAKGSAPSAGNQ